MHQTIKVCLILLLSCALISGCSLQYLVPVAGIRQVSGNEPVDIKLTHDQYSGELDSILKAIDVFYAHRTRKAIDTQALRSEFTPRVKAAKSDAELNMILMELFARLHNGHSSLFNWVKEYGTPIRAALIENRLVITNIADIPETIAAGVKPGWIINMIEQQLAEEWMMSQFKYFNASNQEALWERSTERVFRRYETEPETRSYQLLSPDGKTVDVKLSLSTPRSELMRTVGRGMVESKDLGRFGYIAINTMTDGVVEQFDRALTKMLDKDGLIIDLRNNGGGNSANGDQMFRRLIQKDTTIWQGRTAKPFKDLNYSGSVVALIGSYTFSAAESFAFNLYDSGRVTVMGGTTAGDSGGGPKTFATNGGIQFRIPVRGLDFSASGLPMEGVGLKPHFAVNQRYDDFLAGKDTILEAAKIKLEEITKKP